MLQDRAEGVRVVLGAELVRRADHTLSSGFGPCYGRVMDPLTSFVLAIVLSAVGFYVLYWVVRKAVAAGIRDAARGSEGTDEEAVGPQQPDA